MPVTGISEEEIAEKYKEGLEKIFYYRDMLKDLHPFLDNLFPVAIVENDHFHCHQWNTVETGLRNNLPLAINAAKNEDYMWEIS